MGDDDKRAGRPAVDLARRSVSALQWNLAGGGGKIVLQLVIQIALARLLGPLPFGQFSAVLVVLGVGWLLADGGFGAALIQKDRIEPGDVAMALGWVLVTASAVAVVMVLGAGWLAGQFGDPELAPMFRAASVLVFLQSLSNISTSLLRRDLDMKRLQIIQLLSYLLGFGLVAMVLAALGWGAWSLVWGFGVQTLLTWGASFAVARHTLRPRLGGDRRLTAFGVKVVLTNITNWAIENLDRVVVGRFWGVPALGAYTVAFNLSRAPVGVLVGSLQSVAFSAAARIQDDDVRTRRSYLAVLSALALVMFPAFALVALEATAVIDLVYGAQWLPAAPLLAAFAVTTPLYALGALTGPLLQARGAVLHELAAQLLVAAVLLGGFLVLRQSPLAIAVWIVPAAYLARFLFVFFALGRLLPLSWGALGGALGAGTVLAAAVVLADLGWRRLYPWDAVGWQVAMPLVAALSSAFLVVRCSGGRLIGAELRAMLEGRRAESAWIGRLCRLLRLAGPAP